LTRTVVCEIVEAREVVSLARVQNDPDLHGGLALLGALIFALGKIGLLAQAIK
jgi:hypothetical protein